MGAPLPAHATGAMVSVGPGTAWEVGSAGTWSSSCIWWTNLDARTVRHPGSRRDHALAADRVGSCGRL